jgi:hypothetical protein
MQSFKPAPVTLPLTASDQAELSVSYAERTVTCKISIACKPEVVYAAWADVAQWHLWDLDTRVASLQGSPHVGTVGKLTPHKGLPIKIEISEANAPRSFTVISQVLGNRFSFFHTLQPTSDSVIATHQVQFEGWLAGFFMKTVGADVIRGLPLTMTRLKQYCEGSYRR